MVLTGLKMVEFVDIGICRFFLPVFEGNKVLNLSTTNFSA